MDMKMEEFGEFCSVILVMLAAIFVSYSVIDAFLEHFYETQCEAENNVQDCVRTYIPKEITDAQ